MEGQGHTHDSSPVCNSWVRPADPRLGLCDLAEGLGNQGGLGQGLWRREREELSGTRLVESLTKSKEPQTQTSICTETLCLDDDGDVVVAFLHPGLWPACRL